MPGHEPGFGGTEFKGIKERDLAVDLANSLSEFLKSDPHYEVIVARSKEAWNPLLSVYFKDHWDEIQKFRDNQKAQMAELVSEGKVEKITDGVAHNSAPKDVATRLFGINKWENDNDIDIAIHIHFNDYPRQPLSKAGDYSGFTIYVPEKQYSNAVATKVVADSVYSRLSKIFPTSDLPKENVGVVEDQDLIAIGQSNTTDGASMLIEYGYIYEPQFTNPSVRNIVLREMALQTFLGIEDFFGGQTNAGGPYSSTFVPHEWKSNLTKNSVSPIDIVALQAAFELQGVYPPLGRNKNDCPLSGVVGPCTLASLQSFQEKYGITQEKEVIGSATRSKLSQLFNAPSPSDS